jgi:hypothetical protein
VLCSTLKAALRLFGRLQSLQAYANSRTLISTVEVEGIEGMLEDPDELRCPMCGRWAQASCDRGIGVWVWMWGAGWGRGTGVWAWQVATDQLGPRHKDVGVDVGSDWGS